MKSVSLDCKVWSFWAIWANLGQFGPNFGPIFWPTNEI